MSLPLRLTCVEPHYYEFVDTKGVVVLTYASDDAAKDVAAMESAAMARALDAVNAGIAPVSELPKLINHFFDVISKEE